MKTIITTAAILAAITTAAHAEAYTYMCKVGSKSYPVTVTTPNRHGRRHHHMARHGVPRCEAGGRLPI
jgi:hypothetical protein